jgi:4-hydroxyproline epimerase
MRPVKIVDSHTGGEPTRLIIDGGPRLGAGPLVEQIARFRSEHDRFRSAVVCEPRGSDVIVGGLVTTPVDATCASGVLFINNVG